MQVSNRIISLALDIKTYIWHHIAMRTTISLDTDANKAIRTYAKRRRISLGRAASELIRRGTRYQLGTRIVNGLSVVDVPADFPIITTEQVRELLDEE